MLRILVVVLGLTLGVPAHALTLGDLTNQEAATGLKEGLAQSASKAVAQLGTSGGFLDNAKVKIPLPDSIRRVESGLRLMGMGKQADELVISMNRAAEMAVKEAAPVLAGAVKRMTVQDAKTILAGGDTAVTDYFRRSTSAELTQKFMPIVRQATAKVQLAEQYNRLAGQASGVGLVSKDDADINAYVTRKALDGLFLVIGEQERAIRQDPVGAATGMASKVFGAIGK
ncbi:MAG: DUF4197 domain-containing protein [Burkholderiales bacterium]|jgi:hypothetical protein|nr:DUF4197 domain-containing protein [Burkholderiales bacterium]